jgi:hypothetical protein
VAPVVAAAAAMEAMEAPEQVPGATVALGQAGLAAELAQDQVAALESDLLEAELERGRPRWDLLCRLHRHHTPKVQRRSTSTRCAICPVACRI